MMKMTIRRRLRKADSMDRSFLSDSYSARWLSYHSLKYFDLFFSSSFFYVFCIQKSCAEFLFECHIISLSALLQLIITLLGYVHILCNHFWWSWLAPSGALHEPISSFHSAQCQNAHNSHNKQTVKPVEVPRKTATKKQTQKLNSTIII